GCPGTRSAGRLRRCPRCTVRWRARSKREERGRGEACESTACARPSQTREATVKNFFCSAGCLCPHSSVAPDERLGRAVVVRQIGLAVRLELGDDALRQHLPELDAPLVERVDAPDDALCEHAVLVERDEGPERRRCQAFR